MEPLLRPEMKANTESGQEVTVKRLLGSGGQGEVWEVTYDGRAHALKWYYPKWLEADTLLWERLGRLVKKGPPAGNFVWPEALVRADAQPTFGYLMPLLDVSRFVSLRELDARRVNPTFHRLTTVAFNIAVAFW